MQFRTHQIRTQIPDAGDLDVEPRTDSDELPKRPRVPHGPEPKEALALFMGATVRTPSILTCCTDSVVVDT